MGGRERSSKGPTAVINESRGTTDSRLVTTLSGDDCASCFQPHMQAGQPGNHEIPSRVPLSYLFSQFSLSASGTGRGRVLQTNRREACPIATCLVITAQPSLQTKSHDNITQSCDDYPQGQI